MLSQVCCLFYFFRRQNALIYCEQTKCTIIYRAKFSFAILIFSVEIKDTICPLPYLTIQRLLTINVISTKLNFYAITPNICFTYALPTACLKAQSRLGYRLLITTIINKLKSFFHDSVHQLTYQSTCFTILFEQMLSWRGPPNNQKMGSKK